MSLLVTSPNPSGADHLVQRTGHMLMHNFIYGQESKTSNSRMRWCLKKKMPLKEGRANLFFHHLLTAEDRFLPRPSKGACDIFQHLHPSNVSVSIRPSFSVPRLLSKSFDLQLALSEGTSSSRATINP